MRVTLQEEQAKKEKEKQIDAGYVESALYHSSFAAQEQLRKQVSISRC